jgi:signal transduction histidine kinase
MRAIGWPRPEPIDVAWGAFALANLWAMTVWERWETIPFHFIWVSLTLLYGFRVWRLKPTSAVLFAVIAATGTLITIDARHGTQEWGELFEVPLMSAMFLAMVWHGHRRQHAMNELAALAERQELFLNDASHELRTPITIAQGHLELLSRGRVEPELVVALDELRRMQWIVDRLLLLAKADRPDFVHVQEIDLEHFLEDVFLRWSEVAPRAWRLGPVAAGTLSADPDVVRVAIDALLENAVAYTAPDGTIEISSRAEGAEIAIEVADDGPGIPDEALSRIFERFGRIDSARTRTEGGVGLGLAIVDTIAKAHGGRCTLRSTEEGTVFSVHLPDWRASVSASVREPTRTSR